MYNAAWQSHMEYIVLWFEDRQKMNYLQKILENKISNKEKNELMKVFLKRSDTLASKMLQLCRNCCTVQLIKLI